MSQRLNIPATFGDERILASLFRFLIFATSMIVSVSVNAEVSYDFMRHNLWGPGLPSVTGKGFKSEAEALAAARAITSGVLDTAVFDRLGPPQDADFGHTRFYFEPPRVPKEFARQPGSTAAFDTMEETCRDNVDYFNTNDPSGQYSFLRLQPDPEHGDNPYIRSCVCWIGALNKEGLCSYAQPVCPSYFNFLGPSAAVGYGFPAEYSCVNVYYAAIYPRGSEPEKNHWENQCSSRVGNPISVNQGTKIQHETDFSIAQPVGLRWERRYSSTLGGNHGFGAKWRHTYQRRVMRVQGGTATVLVQRENGNGEFFSLKSSTWQPDADIGARLEPVTNDSGSITGWRYFSVSDEVETYDASGHLLSIQSRDGRVVTLSYSGDTPNANAPVAGLLLAVEDQFGRQIQIAYDGQARISTVKDPNGAEIRYTYDSFNNLVKVVQPDGRERDYFYENLDFPDLLTGITDENGDRYATFTYDAAGRALSTQYAGGVNQYVLQHGGANQVLVTDPLGTVRTHHFTTVLGTLRGTGQSQPGGSGCGPASSSIAYDGNGNVASRSDFNGTQTTYSYDLSRNLETQRVKAAGTPQARTTTTEWHPTYRLPTRIAEPSRLTVNDYDARGNLLAKTVQATNDVSGASGFDVTPAGAPRTWHWTYNQYGQVLTATGPRTDVVDKTDYTYDGMGNLVSITNAAGHVTTLSEYDANGRAGRIVDPNGLVTELGYSPRGWLTVRKVGNETTTYDYDGVGQLIRVTHPDGSHVAYTYDDAHRLIAIADSAGNHIDYTLDAVGNRIKEEVKDPMGQLARQTSRVYDALNRLQEITGGMQ